MRRGALKRLFVRIAVALWAYRVWVPTTLLCVLLAVLPVCLFGQPGG